MVNRDSVAVEVLRDPAFPGVLISVGQAWGHPIRGAAGLEAAGHRVLRVGARSSVVPGEVLQVVQVVRVAFVLGVESVRVVVEDVLVPEDRSLEVDLHTDWKEVGNLDFYPAEIRPIVAYHVVVHHAYGDHDYRASVVHACRAVEVREDRPWVAGRDPDRRAEVRF